LFGVWSVWYASDSVWLWDSPELISSFEEQSILLFFTLLSSVISSVVLIPGENNILEKH
jgi:hypothetical protein